MEQKSQLKVFNVLTVCVTLVICAVILGVKIDGIKIPDCSGGHFWGGHLSGNNVNAQVQKDFQKDYLKQWEVPGYLEIDDITFYRLFDRGDFDGSYVFFKAPKPKPTTPPTPPALEPEPTTDNQTNPDNVAELTTMYVEPEYYEPPEDQYIFSRVKLDEYMQKLIEAGKAVQIPAQ